jgi:hypothetical protein
VGNTPLLRVSFGVASPAIRFSPSLETGLALPLFQALIRFSECKRLTQYPVEVAHVAEARGVRRFRVCRRQTGHYPETGFEEIGLPAMVNSIRLPRSRLLARAEGEAPGHNFRLARHPFGSFGFSSYTLGPAQLSVELGVLGGDGSFCSDQAVSTRATRLSTI